MSAYTRRNMVDDLTNDLKISVSQSKQIVEAVIKQLARVMVSGQKIEFRGFGIFVLQVRKSKIGRNPKRLEDGEYTIPARKIIRFRVGKELDKKLNTLA